MSMTAVPGQNLVHGFAASAEVGEVEAGNGGFASEAFGLRHSHLRDARSWFHNPSEFGCGASWNLAGLTETIPYLQDLGVTAVELMSVLEFNENESNRLNPITCVGRPAFVDLSSSLVAGP